MTTETKTLLEKFSALMKVDALGHPNDMDRFFDFIIFAYRNNERAISLDDFLEVVGVHTVNGETIRDVKVIKKRLNFLMFLFSKYEDGMKLLSKFENREWLIFV